jgi:hypothetical protein
MSFLLRVLVKEATQKPQFCHLYWREEYWNCQASSVTTVAFRSAISSYALSSKASCHSALFGRVH